MFELILHIISSNRTFHAHVELVVARIFTAHPTEIKQPCRAVRVSRWAFF